MNILPNGFTPRLMLAVLAGWASISMDRGQLQAEVTAAERQQVADLVKQTAAAGRSFAQGEMEQSAAAVQSIQTEIVELLKANQDPRLQRLVKPVYQRMAKAHDLLELEGLELAPLPSWDDLIKPTNQPQTDGVSFKDDLAPWLVARCGNCHINQNRGNFSMATFAQLRRGTPSGVVIFPGAARSSRLIEVLESGDMPRGGGQLATQQIEQLAEWINAGAQFDGPDPAAPIKDLVVAVPGTGDAMQLSVGRPSGSETVSFTSQIAPILLENCKGCHISGQRASGNLRMDRFADLLKGGDSGPLLVPGKPDESLIVQKIRGLSGNRMPAGGRPALDETEIQLISTWISEGARFDGSQPTASLAADSQLAWADAASHEALFSRRQEQSLAQWSKVSPNDDALSAKNNEFLVLGNVPQERIDEVLSTFAEAADEARKLLKLPDQDPMIKGGMTVFVLNNRYNYGEFGRMIQGHELPKNWQAHWNSEGIDVYGVVLADDGWNEDTTEPLALQLTVGGFLGSYAGVPYWFAEGMARSLVVTKFRRGYPAAAQWLAAQPQAIAGLKNSKDLAAGKLDEDSTGLIGMGLASVMTNRSNRRRFDKLLEELQAGSNFDDAMRKSFGPTPDFLKAVIGR